MQRQSWNRQSPGRNDGGSAWNGSTGKEWNRDGRSGDLYCPVCHTVSQTAGTALLYKLAAAMIQPVSDERVTGCVEAVGEGCQILMQIVFTVGVLFLLTIAIVAAVTNA